MTREEAISIIQYTFLNVDNHLNGNGPKRDAKDINEALLMAIKALLNQPIPSNLDEAAEEVNKSGLIGFGGVCWLTKETPKHFFKAGAEWMAGQGASFNTKVGWIDGPTILDWPDDILDGFEMGDEVIVQIRKK